MPDTMILFKNGQTCSLKKDYNVETLELTVDPPQKESDKMKIKGQFGVHHYNKSYTERGCQLRVLVDTGDIEGVYEKRNELYALFGRLEDFYIIYSREPGIRRRVEYENMKINRPPGSLLFEIIVEFSIPDGFGESIFRSLDAKEWDTNKFAWGMGLEWDDKYDYTFKEKIFYFKNIGSMEINPAQHDITWRIKCDPRYLKITNFTTNDSLTIYNPGAVSQGIIVIKGLHIEDEYGRNLVRHADAGEIHLVPGINQIKIESSTFHWCEVNTRFYYL
ncbi:MULTISPECIES: phage tail domain-containing protein [unclassified Bacillus (in: firmicutes)]|uniref:phage tail domain-containing protein n=1 Tax=unclassified Bacillus (in: firmicutes) TaxID=185979 RepID=UPI0008EAE524|nr:MULTISPECIES: phage tail domain-containing protein [unclassified Bacillus (in: firmicutes)]SFI02277.1 Phage tail protein [Bacillus sp. 71mf]SFS81922.1 Phage tail protein [Bacillus sp. 103mf]